jgi:hypothetical protein
MLLMIVRVLHQNSAAKKRYKSESERENENERENERKRENGNWRAAYLRPAILSIQLKCGGACLLQAGLLPPDS